MKKILSLALVIALVVGLFAGVRPASAETKDFFMVLQVGFKQYALNGLPLNSDVAPEIVGARTFVPIRLIAETFGAVVDWIPASRTVTIKLGDVEIDLTIGSTQAIVGSATKVLEAAPYIKSGRTMVPLRLISESIGLSVYYDPQVKTISIKSATTGAVPGITVNQILIGSFSVQTGPYAVVGVPFSQGMLSYFDMVNDAGGINGRKIKLEVVDDQFNPANTVTVVKKFVTEDNVFAVVGGVGSPGCAAVVDYLNDQKVPFIYQASGLSSLSIPAKPYVFAVQPNYINEGQVIAKYAGSTLGLKNIAVLYSNDQAGNEWLTGTKQGAAKFGGTVALELPFPVTETDFTPYLLKVQASKVDALIIYTSSVATAGLAVKTAKSLGLTQKILLSYVAASIAAVAGADAAEGVYVPGWVDFSNPKNPDVVKFFSTWNKYYPKGNQALYAYACAGWVAAEVFTEAVRRSGPYPTRDALCWALETFNGWSGVLAKDISYSPTEHSGKYSLFFMQVQKGALVKVSDWISVLKP
ncbi:MAG: ABC transporter substrate-binding protein [Candidatus Cryosericum sp.]